MFADVVLESAPRTALKVPDDAVLDSGTEGRLRLVARREVPAAGGERRRGRTRVRGGGLRARKGEASCPRQLPRRLRVPPAASLAALSPAPRHPPAADTRGTRGRPRRPRLPRRARRRPRTRTPGTDGKRHDQGASSASPRRTSTSSSPRRSSRSSGRCGRCGTSRSTRSPTSPTRRSSSTRAGTAAPTSSRTRSPIRS